MVGTIRPINILELTPHWDKILFASNYPWLEFSSGSCHRIKNCGSVQESTGWLNPPALSPLQPDTPNRRCCWIWFQRFKDMHNVVVKILIILEIRTKKRMFESVVARAERLKNKSHQTKSKYYMYYHCRNRSLAYSIFFILFFEFKSLFWRRHSPLFCHFLEKEYRLPA